MQQGEIKWIYNHCNWTDWQALIHLIYHLFYSKDLDILQCYAADKCYEKILVVSFKNKSCSFWTSSALAMILCMNAVLHKIFQKISKW